jgi:hypothetical protein
MDNPFVSLIVVVQKTVDQLEKDEIPAYACQHA